jgi:hypothetical protein
METLIFAPAVGLALPVSVKKETYFARGYANKACIVLLIASLVEIAILKGKRPPAQPLPAAQSVLVNEQIASSKLVLPTPSIIGKWRRKGYGDLEFFKGDDLEFSSFMLGQSIACKYRFVGANQIRVDVPTFYWFSIDRGKIERPSHSEFCTVVFSGNEMKLLGHGEIFPGELQFSRAQ